MAAASHAVRTSGARSQLTRQRFADARRIFDSQDGLRPHHPGLSEDQGGQRNHVFDLVRGIGGPEPIGGSGIGRRRGRVLAGARHDASGNRRPGGQELEQEQVPRLRHRFHRHLRGSPGQPQENPHLERPSEEGCLGDHAQPVPVRRRPVEPYGRLRRAAGAGQEAKPGAGVLEGTLPHRGAGQQRT